MKILSEIAKDALELPLAQRLTLARILLDVSEPDRDFSPKVEVAWEQEINRRIEAVKSGNTHSKSLEKARSFARPKKN
jgi:hypothetical protein